MLKERIDLDFKQSLKNQEKLRLSTLRLLVSEIRNAEIAKQKELSEDELISVVKREIKRRDQAIAEYEKTSRVDLLEKEKAEKDILSDYLPEQLSEDEVEKLVKNVIAELNASGSAQVGAVMGRVMAQVKGKADGSTVRKIVEKILS
ncbi:MAG: GatB/YqeY domain-containing protein [Actinobacteria bacterium]|nr:GatB/YqeY domain-containing protein [Actinomycetota bacterium]